MSRTFTVIRREFTEMVRTKAFLIGTILGPVIMVGFFALQIVLAQSGGGERQVVVVDATGQGLGERVAAALESRSGAESRTQFTTEVLVLGDEDPETLRAGFQERIEADSLDGYLWLPAGAVDGETVVYEGKNATNIGELERIRGAVQVAVQGTRLSAAGIDAARVAEALRPVPFDARKTGAQAASGTPIALYILTYILGFAVYMVVILYGNAVMRGVLEEKRDRVVEVVVSSIRATQLMAGKVIGIGAAGLVQIAIWIGFAAAVLMKGEAIAARFGTAMPELPAVPLSVGLIFGFFFLAGFFLYAGMYAAMGAIATTDQEAQQLQFPVIMLLLPGIMMMTPVLNDPDGAIAVAGSLIPFTAPIVMPMRAVVTGIPPLQLTGSILIVVLTMLVLLWTSAKIYRIGILSTGKRASLGEVWRWLRTA
ncbi:MAG TPA: ABC transporter permease [Longimicrobiales bacterium]